MSVHHFFTLLQSEMLTDGAISNGCDHPLTHTLRLGEISGHNWLRSSWFPSPTRGRANPTHTPVPRSMTATLPPRNPCTGCFAPTVQHVNYMLPSFSCSWWNWGYIRMESSQNDRWFSRSLEIQLVYLFLSFSNSTGSFVTTVPQTHSHSLPIT